MTYVYARMKWRNEKPANKYRPMSGYRSRAFFITRTAASPLLARVARVARAGVGAELAALEKVKVGRSLTNLQSSHAACTPSIPRTETAVRNLESVDRLLVLVLASSAFFGFPRFFAGAI